MQIKRIKASEYTLVTKLFDEYRVFYNQAPNILLAERFIKDRLEHKESVIFVALVDEDGKQAPAGFTQLYPLISSVSATRNWVLNDLYVVGAYRKKGFGEALIRAAMQFSRSKGAEFLQLETAFDNFNAQRLYENIGFKRYDQDSSFFIYRAELSGLFYNYSI